MLSKKARDTLSSQGHAADLRDRDRDCPTTHSLALSNGKRTVDIGFQHALENDGRRLTVTAEVRVSGPLRGDVSLTDLELYQAYPRTLS